MSTSDGSPQPKADDLKDDLLAGSSHIESLKHGPTNIEAMATDIDKLPVSWFVWLVALTASIAGLLFGYDTGIISGALVYLHNDLNGRPVTSSEKELITSLCSGGAFFGAIAAGNTVDRVRYPSPSFIYTCWLSYRAPNTC